VKLSQDRILTTHVGSLPRSTAVIDLLYRKENGETVDATAYDAAIAAGVADAVAKQVTAGIDVVSDGETSKISYSTYIKDRYAGFSGEYIPKTHLDLRDHPDFRERQRRNGGGPGEFH